MKNDPIIHAKASAIVEAIKDKKGEKDMVLVKQGRDPHHYNEPYYSISSITEALASLGGEVSQSAKQFLESKGIKDTLYDVAAHNNGQPDQWVKGGLSALLNEYASQFAHPSEREGMSGEQFYEKFREVRNELSAVTGTCSLSEAIIKTFDRYLAEKQSKTEKK